MKLPDVMQSSHWIYKPTKSVAPEPIEECDTIMMDLHSLP